LYMHYCCGRLDKIDFDGSKKDKCPFSNSISQKGCCDEKQVDLKIKSDYKAETESKIFFKDIVSAPPATHFLYNIPVFDNAEVLHYSGVSPPLEPSVPLYIFICKYRI
jgi:hypothetical protein